ncbi:MAG: diguanylate cyclase [Spirochaetaceae bacterium]|nr:MAG: diguanylate cyclase [Spirochaetaceae bacterium]
MKRTAAATIVVVIVIAVTMISFVFPVLMSTPYRRDVLLRSPVAVGGVLDTSGFHFFDDWLLPLQGEWLHAKGRLLDPDGFSHDPLTDPTYEMLELPHELTDPRDTAGTVRLHLIMPEEAAAAPGLLALRLRYFASSYRVWINGELRAESGAVSENRDGYRAQYIPAEILFDARAGLNEIVIQFADFHHRRIRLNRLYVGPADHVLALTMRGLIHQSLILGTFLLAAIYFGTLFLIQKSEPANLYLSLIALVSAGRIVVVSERLLIRLIPSFHPELMMKMGYAGSILIVPLIILYISEGFRISPLKPVARLAKYLLWAAAAFLILTPVRVYDLLFAYGQIPVMLIGVYAIILLSRHRILSTVHGGRILVPTALVLLITGASDVFRELGLLSASELFSSGMVVFLAVQGIFLAWRFQVTFDKVEALSDDNRLMVREISALNAQLEQRVSERTEELEAANRQLAELSRKDELTGLMNRRGLVERIELEQSLARREERFLSVLMIDIDHFKPYNDGYGHPAGDRCLRQIAEAISSCCERGADLPARYGGEEFVVLLPQTKPDGALRVAKRIQDAIRKRAIPHAYSETSDIVTVSIGTACERLSGDGGTGAIENADRALYAAKGQGRNRICSSDADQE